MSTELWIIAPPTRDESEEPKKPGTCDVHEAHPMCRKNISATRAVDRELHVIFNAFKILVVVRMAWDPSNFITLRFRAKCRSNQLKTRPQGLSDLSCCVLEWDILFRLHFNVNLSFVVSASLALVAFPTPSRIFFCIAKSASVKTWFNRTLWSTSMSYQANWAMSN